jgi:hypothetical protein
VVGPQLRYLTLLHSQALAELVEQELALFRRALNFKRSGRSDLPGITMPSPLTGSVRLRPGNDPLLRLDPDAIKRLDPSAAAVFDSNRPAVAVSLEFLGAARDLPPLGVIPAVQAGDLFFGWVNLERVAALAKHEAVVRIEALRTWAPTSNSSGGDGIPNGRSPGTATTTGHGVRLVVIDLGFDFLHPGLVREVAGAEQVRALWLHDMELPPEQLAPAGALGRRFTATDLQAALDWYLAPLGQPAPPTPCAIKKHLGRLVSARASADYKQLLQQHGTAVTGIAAGNGRGRRPDDTIPPVLGVAPEADLVLIAIGAHDETRFADSSEVFAAFQAAFEDSSAPCVALMANSDSLGPHDGSLDGELFLNELLLLPGRAVVLTAGNLNHVTTTNPALPPYHAVAQVEPENGPPLPLVLRYSAGALVPDSAEVWFRPPAGTYATATISLRIDDEPTERPPVTITEGAAPVTILDPMQNAKRTAVSAQLERDDEADAHCLRLVFRPARRMEIVESVWTISVTAEGPVHGCLDRNNATTKRWEGAPAQASASRTTLSSPASAIRPLTVGSVASPTGAPSDFSGRGPLRAPPNAPRKPDLVAVGENPRGPFGNPFVRVYHGSYRAPGYVQFNLNGTSFAAPQVAGACALLFERFGPAATWADIRQAILQATVRPAGMPAPVADNWDPACGYGLLDLDAVRSPPMPAMADVWLPKTRGDNGTEPFVDWTFWDSPALVLEDAAGHAMDPSLIAIGGATPARLRLRVGNRGAQSASDVVLTAWWAPLGAAHPLPRPDTGGGTWQAGGFGVGDKAGNQRRVPEIAPGDFVEAVFDWEPPRDPQGGILPHLLLVTASAEDDPYDPTDTACAQNNVAMLSIAAARRGAAAAFQILGSEDTDGLILWRDSPDAGLRIEELPVTALPWRDAAMFQRSRRMDRPLYGAPRASEDMAIQLSAQLEGPEAVAAISDVLGAKRLVLRDGRVTIDSRTRLTLPRLRIAHGTPLNIKVTALDDAGGAIHMLHLSGGRRVGGGTMRFPA